jgi:hypothetical protein
MHRLIRRSPVLLASVVAVGLLATPAAAAVSSAWRPANECASLSVNLCSRITTVAGSTRVTADDGSCTGQVGVSVKSGSTISPAYFANTSITVTGSGITQYKVWH